MKIKSNFPDWITTIAEKNQASMNKESQDYFEKVKKTNLERYGTENVGYLAKTSPRSKKEKLLESILIDYRIDIRIGKYKPDYVNESTKHVIEVYGDYWHCNPKLFEEDFYHLQLKKTAKEKRDQDQERINYLESQGYKVTIVWESDLNEFIQTL